jgi:outer membrane protein assembly factor BamE (lipoprotein component of BamABCDE complex)
MRKVILAGFGGVAAALSVTACAPTTIDHGFVSELVQPRDVQVGVDTKATVMARLGTPSTTGVFDATSWYYISYRQERLAFFRPETSQRTITAIRFGENDVVAAVETFGVERGRVVSYADAETPTRGRELGFLEQIFGSIGRVPVQTDPEDEAPRRN